MPGRHTRVIDLLRNEVKKFPPLRVRGEARSLRFLQLHSSAMESIRTTFARLASWEPTRRVHRFLMPTLFVVGFGAYMSRRRGVLSRPALFAEDGQVFFLSSIRDGVRGINDVYNGYLIVGTRTLAFLATLFPISWTPSTYAVLSGLVAIGCCAIATRSQLTWAFGGWIPRALVFLALVFLPQITETHATLTNTIWWGGVGLLLIGLSDEPITWWGRLGELGFVVIVTLTGPIGIVLSPIVVWRLWRVRSPWTAVLTAAWAVSCLIQLVVLRGQERKVEPVTWGQDLSAVAIRRWFGPFTTGTAYVQSHLAGPAWSRLPWVLTVAFAFALFAIAVRGRDRGAGLVLLVLGAAQIGAGFVALGPLAVYLPDRYTVGATASVIFIVAAARPTQWPLRVIHVVVVVWMVVGWPRNVSVPHREAPSFAEAGRCLEQSNTTCRVPAIPDPFSFLVTPTDR